MDIATRTEKDVTVVAFSGSLDSNTSPQAQQALDGIARGRSAEGGRRLHGARLHLERGAPGPAGDRQAVGRGGGGGALRLFGLNQTVREVFDISGFSTILAVVATEADALKGF